MSEQIIEPEYTDYEDDMSANKKMINATGDSPCEFCPNAKGDKNLCVEKCLRLKEFQFNRPYKHIKFYCSTKHTESQTLPQIANKPAETPNTTEPIPQETTPWQKAMPIRPKRKPVPTPISIPIPIKDDADKPVNLMVQKMAQKPRNPSKAEELTYGEKLKIIADTDKCLVCGRPKSEYKLRRGLCLAKCSGAWRDGRIAHPLFGKWVFMSPEEVHNSRCGKYGKCLMPDCNEKGDRRGLCQGHYRKWIRNKLLHPLFGKWFPKGKKKKEVKPMEKQAIYETAKPEKKEQPINYEINLQTKDNVPAEGTTVTIHGGLNMLKIVISCSSRG